MLRGDEGFTLEQYEALMERLRATLSSVDLKIKQGCVAAVRCWLEA